GESRVRSVEARGDHGAPRGSGEARGGGVPAVTGADGRHVTRFAIADAERAGRKGRDATAASDQAPDQGSSEAETMSQDGAATRRRLASSSSDHRQPS